MRSRPFGVAVLPDEDMALLRGMPGATVAVTDDGIIGYASPEALAVLGWDGALAGQPLTRIIPERLRHRHLAGFRRYVATGVSRLQGVTVRVPALRRDGGETDIDLTIRVFQRPDGSKIAVAGVAVAASGIAPPHLVLVERAFARRLYELV